MHAQLVELQRLAVAVRVAARRLKHHARKPRINLEDIMSALDDATNALEAAVAANTTATNELIAALASAAPTAAQIAAIAAQTSAVTANTNAITTALTPPAPVEPAAEPAPAEVDPNAPAT